MLKMHKFQYVRSNKNTQLFKYWVETKNIFIILFLVIHIFSGCSTQRNRSPSPTLSVPVENADQLAPESMRPEIPNEKKLDPEYLQSQASYHFSVGQSFSLEGNTDRAIEEYKLALVYDSQSAILHSRLASEYVKKGLISFAIDESKTAVQLDKDYTDARLLLAGLYSSTRLVKEALEQYDEILKQDPKNSEAYIFKASLLIDEDRVDEAVQVLKKLIAKEDEFFWAHYYLGRAYQKQNKKALAKASFEKAIKLKPGLTQAGLTLGLILEDEKNLKEALKVYENLYKNTGDLQAVARLSQLYIESDDYEKALKYLTILEQSDDDNLNVKVKLGLIYVERKQYDKAVDVFQKILKKNSDTDKVRYYMASVYEEQKRYEEAIQEFKKISNSSGMKVDAIVHIANLYKIKGDISAANEIIENGIVENPDAPSLVLFKASLLDDAKKTPEAITYLELALNKFSTDEKLIYFLGTLYEKQNASARSIQVMQKLLTINPDNVHALNYLGYTYTAKGEKLEEAEKLIFQALKLKPNDGYIQDSYGFLLLRKGQVKKATLELEKANRLKPDEPVILEHLGDAYLRQNLKQKALQKYNEALKLMDENKSDLSEIEKLQKKVSSISAKGHDLPN